MIFFFSLDSSLIEFEVRLDQIIDELKIKTSFFDVNMFYEFTHNSLR